MITGVIRDSEAWIEIEIFGRGTIPVRIQAIVDTGFTSWLSLPPDLIQQLQLTWSDQGRARLADGQEILFDVYVASIIWDGQPRDVLIDEANCEPLVGMAMLSGFNLNADIVDGGRLHITRVA